MKEERKTEIKNEAKDVSAQIEELDKQMELAAIELEKVEKI